MTSRSIPNYQLPTPKKALIVFSGAAGLGKAAVGVGSWELGVGAFRASAEIDRWR
jgi:hypothetical protein